MHLFIQWNSWPTIISMSWYFFLNINVIQFRFLLWIFWCIFCSTWMTLLILSVANNVLIRLVSIVKLPSDLNSGSWIIIIYMLLDLLAYSLLLVICSLVKLWSQVFNSAIIFLLRKLLPIIIRVRNHLLCVPIILS